MGHGGETEMNARQTYRPEETMFLMQVDGITEVLY